MKRIYVAGPISRGNLRGNIEQATAAFVALTKAGLCPFCPHWSCFSGPVLEVETDCWPRTYHAFADAQPNELTHADWLRVDLAWVAVSDAVLRLPGESPGADAEVAHALGHCIPVFESVADVVAWAERLA